MDIGYDLKEAYETGYEEGYQAGYEAGQRYMEDYITYDVYNYENEGMQWR